ncbi:uncharacterized protein LOC135826579 [Sycon ciliatum]|uniref:uncharacterized protein LOC135826579 n=1 Tax=Sycon ciliatum TaxID=27933 RepID=UPI0031F61ABD
MATLQIQLWLCIGILIYFSYRCGRTSAAYPVATWKACAQTNTSTWQVDWTFQYDSKLWKDANISCRSLGGSLATVQTMAQLTCANWTAEGTSATWVGLTGTWTAGNWSAWKWEAALSSVTAQLRWDSKFPLIRPDYKYGYFEPDIVTLRTWDKNQSLRYLCQRYVPKDNWYVCSANNSLGRLEILYNPTPKTYYEATTDCAGRFSILANIQSLNHAECARSVLGPRNGQCSSSSSDNCKNASFGCKANTCNVWVALQQTSKNWTWVLPVPSIPSKIQWINSTTGGSGERKCGYYLPEEEGFGIEYCTMKLSFYCQRYTPNAPSNIAVDATETEIFARLVQPQILREWISGFCFVYAKNRTAAFTTLVCGTSESMVLANLSANTSYRVQAFYTTTTGINSSIYQEVYISTLPRVKWETCSLISSRTWQVDWTFQDGLKTWTEAKTTCQSYGGSLATVQTMAQLTCANLTVKGTSGVWVGLTGTWTAGGWSAWNWEVTSSTRTTKPPWSSQYRLPFNISDRAHGYYELYRGLLNFDKNLPLRYLCQRYVPKVLRSVGERSGVVWFLIRG